jgi:hypothetical protein
LINLRFHIVSLVAVFLALAIGIAVGATVVDQGLVSQSQRRIAALDSTLQDRAKTIEDLRKQRTASERFEVEAEPRMVRGRLAVTPVLIVSDAVIDTRRLSELSSTLRAAGARILGTLTIGRALSVTTSTDLTRARLAVSATSTRPETVQFLLRERIIAAIARPSDLVPLQPVVDAGFVDRRDPEGGVFPGIVPSGTRVIFVHQASSDAAVEVVGAFLGRLAESGTPVTVVGSGDDPIVNRVRAVPSLAGRIASVDNVDTRAGRVATVYALEDLARGRAGSFGVADGAERLIPAA